MINITYDPRTLEKLRILLHSLETPLHWTMELGKKAGGFALCILVPEPRPAPNTRYQLEREWVFQGNALLMQNIALFMRIITLTLHFHFCQGKEEHSEDNKWQRSFFLPTILWVCFVWLSVSIKKNQKNPINSMVSPFYLIIYQSYLEGQTELWKETQEKSHKGVLTGFVLYVTEGPIDINRVWSTSEADLRNSIFNEREPSV